MGQKGKANDTIRLGENISTTRQQRGMTQEDMARELQLRGFEISRSTYAKIELGMHTVDVSVFEAIKDILETTYDELLKPWKKSEK